MTKYLDYNGLSTLWNRIKSYVEVTTINLIPVITWEITQEEFRNALITSHTFLELLDIVDSGKLLNLKLSNEIDENTSSIVNILMSLTKFYDENISIVFGTGNAMLDTTSGYVPVTIMFGGDNLNNIGFIGNLGISSDFVNGLSTVATSGSYNDLNDTPTIPDDSNIVHLTGTETITGDKTFTGEISHYDLSGGFGWIYDGHGDSLQDVIDDINETIGDINTVLLMVNTGSSS